MLIWISALHCEAKPVIDFYRLKKASTSLAFDSYVDQNKNPSMACIVTGPGRVSCAAATAWSAASYASAGLLSWINIGTCGSKQTIGSLFSANKIIDDHSSRSYFPIRTFKNSIAGTTCRTFNSVATDYKPDEVFDMEASAFYMTASRFSTAEFIHSLKVVSDNEEVEFPSSKNQVSDLIAANIDPISVFASQLIELEKSQQALTISRQQLQSWLDRTHFTQNQQHQLTSKLHYLLNRQWCNQQLLEITEGVSHENNSSAAQPAVH